ncbi:MAG: type II secretion system F family protein [Polyangiales bacterium]
MKRAEALEHSAFRVLEPCVRALGAWVALVPMDALRQRMELRLRHAGHYLGFSADELLASCALSAVGFGVFASLVSGATELPPALVPVGFLFGALLPLLRISLVARERLRRVDRALPDAVELAALCMGAGLDFPGSLQKIVECASDPRDPLIEELGCVLRELRLGYTRQRAMDGFADRVPTPTVREFVNSVVQAERKGSPLVRVLTIQAKTQRLRRSVAAEELASGAALMLIGPMTLIFLCVILLVLGPLIIRFITGDLGGA